MKLSLLLLSTALLLTACKSETATITGRFTGCAAQTVYLDRLLPGEHTMVDSAVIDRKGHFKFSVVPQGGQTTIYNLRYNDELITLAVSPSERITLNSLCNISYNYIVEGSPESERIRELNMMLTSGARRLDSLLNRYISIPDSDPEAKRRVGAEYTELYYKLKQNHIEFIVTEPGKISSLYALYQRLPRNDHISDPDSDILYYRLVADSVGAHHPASPYLAPLRQIVLNAENAYRLNERLTEKALARAGFDLPDLELRDIYGQMHRLSSLKGKVILLDFLVADSPQSKLHNAELRELYEEAAGRGFEIYQVAGDIDRNRWISAVQLQKLPWISVSDLRGPTSSTFVIYNVRSLPSNFLIGREGDILEKNIYGQELRRRVNELLQ